MRVRRGFTLVELLVVIGIIAVLISMLLPALSVVRRQANQTKCAAALREVGTANTFYVNENHGWAPPAKTLTVYRISYTNLTPPYDDTNNQYWFTMLAKYVTRAKQNLAVTTTTDAAAVANNVLWGCPAFEKYGTRLGTAGAVGGFYESQTGYGFNAFPEYTPSYPRPGQTLGDSGLMNAVDNLAIATPNTTDNWATVNTSVSATPAATGRWYKFSKYNNASQRVLVADAIFWLLEVDAVPLSGQYTQGQKFSVNAGAVIITPGSGQSTYDMYRHGKFPPTQTIGSAGTYSIYGGKIAYNALFCDGHVTTLTDKEGGSRAARMHFPG